MTDMSATNPLTGLAAEGTPIEIGGKNTIRLDEDADNVWIIVEGKVDIFGTQFEGDVAKGPGEHLMRLGVGEAMFSLVPSPDAESRVQLVGAGVIGTVLVPLSRKRLIELAAQSEHLEEFQRVLKNWVSRMMTAIQHGDSPKQYLQAEVGKKTKMLKEECLRPDKGLIWIKPGDGQITLFAEERYGPVPQAWFPLCRPGWIAASEKTPVEVIDTATWMESDPELEGLQAFDQFCLHALLIHLSDHERATSKRFFQRKASDSRKLRGSLVRLGALLEAKRMASAQVGEDPLMLVTHMVAQAQGVRVVQPENMSSLTRTRDKLLAVAASSNFRLREVALHGDWWRGDSGPMIGYMGEERRPVALIPRSATSYDIYDPQSGERRKFTEEDNQWLNSFADTLYPSFPLHKLTGWDVFKFGLRGCERDVATIFIVGAVSSILTLITPWATALIFDTIIPSARVTLLYQLLVVMITAAIAVFVFQITRDVAMLRLQGRMEERIQSAVWDRLLGLPVSFFRKYTAGDLSDRAQGISAIQKLLSGMAITSILAGMFSIINVPMMFYYAPLLATAGVLIVMVALVLMAVLSILKVKYQRRVQEIDGEIQGFVLEFLTGISKFRATGSERRAFAYWARRFAEQKLFARKVGTVGNIIEVFGEVFPVFATLVVFVALSFVLKTPDGEISTGNFLAFNAAFLQFLVPTIAMSRTFALVLNIIPLYERTRPILETVPEVTDDKLEAGPLVGDIEVSHVSFRYDKDGPLILEDVNVEIKAGEFIALVGSSGSGKSTLFRLLLAFEKLSDGSIFYDGKDLSSLDVRSVRRQIGVVLQNGELMAGTIFENIVGTSLATVDDAWEAVRLAGMEEDIQNMPMGMHTVIPQGGGTLSGGQRQRVLISRALIGKPRVLFFDEATSALDNKTQAIVSQSLERLKTTRVVIAHRLSTIVNADRIYVLEKGRMVESGNYDELMEIDGLFADLARRQMA